MNFARKDSFLSIMNYEFLKGDLLKEVQIKKEIFFSTGNY